MKLLPGWHEPVGDIVGLDESSYGSKQASREFHELWTSEPIDFVFGQGRADIRVVQTSDLTRL